MYNIVPSAVGVLVRAPVPCFRPFRLSCIAYAMKNADERETADERNAQRGQNSKPSTLRKVYSKNGSGSVREKIRQFRTQIKTKNRDRGDGSKMRDPYDYDESEEEFLAALGMGRKIPKREEITQEMVGLLKRGRGTPYSARSATPKKPKNEKKKTMTCAF